ncbi:MAG: N-formylglutamate amidohydrolase [Arenicellales bacterium]
MKTMIHCHKEPRLLTQADSPPFELIQSDTSNVLVVCDHASNVVPEALNGLGVAEQHFSEHIAIDIGAAEVSRLIAKTLNASVVLAGFSRLVIDPNRFLSAKDSIPQISDQVVINGNQGLSEQAKMLRIEELFLPYHYAVNQAITHIKSHYAMPFMVFVHSFTPVFQGQQRPWEIGILWEGDEAAASLLIDFLRENTAYNVGENEPYHACSPVGYTAKTHAESKGYPHILIEIRQDMILDEEGQAIFAKVLTAAIEYIQSVLQIK